MTRTGRSKRLYYATVLVQVCATLFMTGVIWTIQLVHYPLFKFVDPPAFVAFAHFHRVLITIVVAVPMVAELITALLLFIQRPLPARRWVLWTGFALLVIIWTSTAFVQVPLHEALSAGFDPNAHEALVRTNWIRTLAWTGRSVLVGSLIWTGGPGRWRRRKRRAVASQR